MVFMLRKSHHHGHVTHVELGNTGHQSLLMLLHDWRDPPQHILVLLSQNTANTQYIWSVRLTVSSLCVICLFFLFFCLIKMKCQKKIVEKCITNPPSLR